MFLCDWKHANQWQSGTHSGKTLHFSQQQNTILEDLRERQSPSNKNPEEPANWWRPQQSEFHHPAHHCLAEGSVLAVTWLVNIQLESVCLGKAPRDLPGKNITKFNSKQHLQLLWFIMEVDFISSENSPSPGSVCALHTSRYSIWLWGDQNCHYFWVSSKSVAFSDTEHKSKTFIPYKNPSSLFHNRSTRQKTLSTYLKEIPAILQGSFFGRVHNYPSITYPAQCPKELELTSEGNVTPAPSIYIPVTDPQCMQVVLGFCFPQ